MIELNEGEYLTQKGQISMPYTWWVGETGSHFLIGLRDDGVIIGNRCEKCQKVFVPPRKNCGYCFSEMTQWVEIGDEGLIRAHTVIRFSSPLHPCEAPFSYALIQLDGADVAFMHLIKNDLDKLANNVRVKARFKDKSLRVGHILDIDCFQII